MQVQDSIVLFGSGVAIWVIGTISSRTEEQPCWSPVASLLDELLRGTYREHRERSDLHRYPAMSTHPCFCVGLRDAPTRDSRDNRRSACALALLHLHAASLSKPQPAGTARCSLLRMRSHLALQRSSR